MPRHIPACGYLKLDLGKVERVYAEHGNYTRADPGERVVLKNTKMQSASECDNGSMFYDVQASMFLELAWLGKGMGGHPAVMRGYEPCSLSGDLSADAIVMTVVGMSERLRVCLRCLSLRLAFRNIS